MNDLSDASVLSKPGAAEYPATPFQLSMLFHSLAEPSAGFYVQQVACFIGEPIDAKALREAWNRVAARHDALRTGFVWSGASDPVQRVRPRIEAPWTEQPWDREWSALAEGFLAPDRARGFDLSEAPLMRLTLLSRNEADHCLVWTFHHAILDGWSMNPLIGEVFAIYDALRAGVPVALPKPRQFGAYVAELERTPVAESKAFWTEALAGFEAPTRLQLPAPTDTKGSPNQSGLAELELDAVTSAGLRALGAEHGFNLNTVCQAAWALLLSRYSGQTDVMFGVTRADRRAEKGAPPMMGLAMNALPLRIAIPPRAPVLTWLKQLRADWKAAGAHARTPLPQIREWCELPRHVAPFETLMSFEFGQLDNRIRSLPGDWSRRRFKVSRRSSVPITFLAYDEARLKLAIEFHKQALDQATAERMLRELRRWLEAVCDDPTLTTDRLAALAPQEAFAPIESEAPLEPATLDGGSVVSAFRAKATARPEAPAIGGERTLSYGALDERSERIARALMARGVGRGTVVGVYGERTADAIAGILGVLKAGAAYLPLDPTYPDDRLAFMAAHSGTRVILGDETARARLASPGLEVIDLAAAQAADRGPTPGPLAEPGAEDPAYVIYTSGSTGRPKGVVVRHRNLAYSTAARLSYYREPVDSFLLLSSLSFDSSVAGIFWTLCSGGRLVLPPSGAEREPPELAAIVQKERVTHLLGLASLYGLVLETGAAALQSLRVCVVAGEPCPPTLVAEHLAALPGARLYNEYGPTEASVWCTVHRADHAPSGPRTPIGAPIPGARIYIVADGRLAPVGTPGEIFVGGPGVAQGYLNSPELTERSFVADSFGGRPGERLYRTGDLARLLPDGSIDLLGRVDHQVKIRGHRIELEEVEAALSGLPAVRAAAVAVLEATPGAKQLTAFLVFREGPRPTEAGVREMLRGRLPAFMIPAAFLAVDALPTGANGKLDREALSRVAGAPLQRAVHVAPATPAQRELASLWCELLALKGVGVHDDFFALGGDSLSAVRLVNQINAHCGVRLRVADLYEHPTIEGLARLVETVPETGRGTAAIVTLKAGDGPLPLYIFHTGPKEVRFAQLIDRRPIYSIEQPWPDAWLRGSEPGGARSIPSAEEIVAPLVDLVLEHTRGRPFALAGHSTKGLLAFELARQVRARGGRPELMVLFDTWRDHPTRLRVALHRWRRALKTRDDAGRVWESGAAVLRAAARQLARKARNALWPWLGLHVPKGGEYELTSVFNQDGVLQRWSRVEPVYAKVAATYRPQPQPMAGILFTAAKATDFDARAIDATMGWGGLFERGLDLVPVPADHDFTIGPDDPALARAMNAGLGRRWPRLTASPNQRVEVAPGLA